MTSQNTTLRILSQTLVAVTQVVGQGVSGQQIVKVECGDLQSCDTCISALVELYRSNGEEPDAERIAQECQSFCTCALEDVDLSLSVSCDFGATLSNATQEEFTRTFESNLELYYSSQGQSLLLSGATNNQIENIQKSVGLIFQETQTNDVQVALSRLRVQQLLRVRGPFTVTGLDMSQMVDLIKNVLLQNERIATQSVSLTQYILQVIEQTNDSSRNELIRLIVSIVTIIIMVAFLIVIVILSLQIHTLLSS